MGFSSLFRGLNRDEEFSARLKVLLFDGILLRKRLKMIESFSNKFPLLSDGN